MREQAQARPDGGEDDVTVAERLLNDSANATDEPLAGSANTSSTMRTRHHDH